MREKVQTIIDETDGIIIRDPSSIKWKDFVWNNGYFKHKISKLEIERPYLLSQTYYGTIDYWDIIFLVNGVEDIFEIVPLSEILIPKIEDIKSFIALHRV